MAMFGDPEDFVVMSEREKYLYDLQGFSWCGTCLPPMRYMR